MSDTRKLSEGVPADDAKADGYFAEQADQVGASTREREREWSYFVYICAASDPREWSYFVYICAASDPREWSYFVYICAAYDPSELVYFVYICAASDDAAHSRRHRQMGR